MPSGARLKIYTTFKVKVTFGALVSAKRANEREEHKSCRRPSFSGGAGASERVLPKALVRAVLLLYLVSESESDNHDDENRDGKGEGERPAAGPLG